MGKTIETHDYSIFKQLEINREINNLNLKKIIASLESNNLLEFNPIIVNKKMQVVDGQHRLEAAKHLNISVWYVINEDSSDEDIILLNSAKRSWGFDDYLNFYMKLGKVEYIRLFEFAKNRGISPSSLYRSFCKCSGSTTLAYFKAGNLKFPANRPIQELEDILDQVELCVNEIKKYCFSKRIAFQNMYFLKGLSLIFELDGFEINTFLKKIQLKSDVIRSCGSTHSYFNMFLDIYNYRNPHPIKE